MKHLSAGTTKFLLLDSSEIERNVSRAPKQGPIVHVVEMVGDKAVQHVGYGVLAEGPVSLTYDQRRFAGFDGREGFHAALTTTGDVVIAEFHGEELTLETEAAPAATTKPAKSAAKKDSKNG